MIESLKSFQQYSLSITPSGYISRTLLSFLFLASLVAYPVFYPVLGHSQQNPTLKLVQSGSNGAETSIENIDPETITLEPVEPVTPEAPPYEPQFPPGAVNQFRIGEMPKGSGRIAFTASIDGIDHILVLDLASRRVVPLIGGPGNNWYPSWSPDGSKLAFSSDRDGVKNIYISEWDGSNQQRLSSGNRTTGDPSWDPEGNAILHYLEDGERGHSNIYRTEIESGKSTKLTRSEARNTTPRSSLDGRFIAFSSNRNWPGWDICVYDNRSGSEDCVVKGTTPQCRPFWSSSSSNLIFSTGSGQQIDLGEYQFSSRAIRKLTRIPGREYDAIYSPKGNEIIFVAEGETPGNYNIYLLPAKATIKDEPELLLASPFSIRFLSWAPRSTVELEVERIKEEELAAKQRELAEKQQLDLPEIKQDNTDSTN